MTEALDAAAFPAFFEALWGVAPFPWQARLLRQVAEGGWPDLLDLPTGSGKTAALDIAVFHLALEADSARRRAAMRIALVVDRRLVVDATFGRASRIAECLQAALAEAPGGILHTVAARLMRLAGDGGVPLVARQLRGGLPREDDWARTPCQPTVLCSTVDQVGSRLLFRGYGITDAMKPLHAGLLGSDALILLDEAHLSEPFRQTARDIATVPALRGSGEAPFHVALLTATPWAAEDASRFALDAADRATQTLRRRLAAPKPVDAVRVESDERRRGQALAQRALELLTRMQAAGMTAPVIGVVANRIARARAAHAALLDVPLAEPPVLLIGRARAVERDRLAEALRRIVTGHTARPETPTIVVATQTIEAGVDLDFDALVTDAASLDALRQRFGRLNRGGRDIAARGSILFGAQDGNRRKPDPIYGTAIAATLEALFPDGTEEVDFGIDALDTRLAALGLGGERLLPLLAEKPRAPVLMPDHVDQWSHTAPVLACASDPALFLHGPRREASVQLLWRADLQDAGPHAGQNERVRALLALAPPRPGETIELPLSAVRRWLAGERSPELGDAEGEESEISKREGGGASLFRWKGAKDARSMWIEPRAIRAGDVLVAPSGRGGCDTYGWDPDCSDPVGDVFDKASEPYEEKRLVVRVSPGLIRQAVVQARAQDRGDQTLAERDAAAEAEQIARRVSAALDELGASPSATDVVEAIAGIIPQSLAQAVQRITGYKRAERPVFAYDAPESGMRSGVVLAARGGTPDSSTEDDETGSYTGIAQTLPDHVAAVCDKARAFASLAGLPPALVDDLALAAQLHDAGKADRRFQRLLSGNDPFAALGIGVPLAKSASGRSPLGAWARAGLPPHWRHEALSVRLALGEVSLQQANDRALVLWLVGTHHGHGRPFFPHDDPDEPEATPGPQSLAFVLEGEAWAPSARDGCDLRGLDWAAMFALLRARYGAWGLARLEAMLRLADHRVSEAGASA
jgi:CRISPR-associated endonuclease/helicase Cas3